MAVSSSARNVSRAFDSNFTQLIQLIVGPLLPAGTAFRPWKSHLVIDLVAVG
jgi:hypothetical protein